MLDGASHGARLGDSKEGVSNGDRTRNPRSHSPVTSLADRFWRKVDKNGPVVRLGLGRCWIWTGAYSRLPDGRRGYGSISVHDKTVKCHRFAWKLTHGEIPAGLFVCHRCDNPRCVRPDHLFVGTAKDNIHDAVRKGRMRGANSIASLVAAFSVAAQEEDGFPGEASSLVEADEVLFGELSFTMEEP